jgi:hypothetical protein
MTFVVFVHGFISNPDCKQFPFRQATLLQELALSSGQQEPPLSASTLWSVRFQRLKMLKSSKVYGISEKLRQ